jgi:Glycosyltransferase family 87
VFVKCRDGVFAGSPGTELRPEPSAEAPRGRRVAGHFARAARLGHLKWYALRPEHGLGFDRRRLAIWYAGFAVYAGLVLIFSGGGADGIWGGWATAGYALAALVALRSRSYAVPLLVALAVALLAPMAWLALRDPATADVLVVARSAILLLRDGSPYLSAGQLATWQSYNPYLPAMALFGLPAAIGLPHLGDPRLWLTLASAVLLAFAFALVGQHRATRCGSCRWVAAWCAVFAVASPVLALPLAVGITDPPVIALMCAALACAERFRLTRAPQLPFAAGVAIGFACAMKATAWPALAVIAAMFIARDGVRVAGRFVATSLVTTAGLIAATAPGLLKTPTGLLQNTVLYPLGMTQRKTPAASPMPGHLLASTGEAGHLTAIWLLVTAAVVIAASLVVRPPADAAAATRRLAIGLAVMFVLAPQTRFGYFSYPVALLGWLAMTRLRARPAGRGRPAVQAAVPAQVAATNGHAKQASGRGEALRRAVHYLLPERGTPGRARHRRKAGEHPMTS